MERKKVIDLRNEVFVTGRLEIRSNDIEVWTDGYEQRILVNKRKKDHNTFVVRLNFQNDSVTWIYDENNDLEGIVVDY
jgi:hypothetical protein